MKRQLASAWVIARRDYVASVFSRTFLFFLLGPVLIFATVALITFVTSSSRVETSPPRVEIALAQADSDRIEAARRHLADKLGGDVLPDIAIFPPLSVEQATAQIRKDSALAAVLTGSLAKPVLTTAKGEADMSGPIGLLIDTARAAPEASPLVTHHEVAPPPAAPQPTDNADLAHGAQAAVFFFILLLCGMLLSNFVEEKSNKVIEVLAAAVPVDAIFVGKLMGMLAISVTAILAWGVTGGIGAALLLPAGKLSALGVPAVGWPIFFVLSILYFAMTYLLIGAVFLGIGSQAASPRDVQMMSLPVTMGQAVLLAFASAGVARPHGWIAITSAIFPWSSPMAMIGRAAELPTLWTHIAALAWQALWLVLAIRLVSRRFRRAVLKSGGGSGRAGARRPVA